MRKNVIREQIEREREYLNKQEVGSEEHVASQQRLMSLEKLYKDCNNQRNQLIIDGAKVVTGIAMPLIGLVCITAAEKEITFVGALRDYTKLFLPKK